MNSFVLVYLFACTSDKGIVVYNTPPEANIILHDDGASIFCNSSSCYATGTTMGDIYNYRSRCVRVCQ